MPTTRRRLLIALAAALALIGSPAYAKPNRVVATVRVSEGYYPVTGSSSYTSTSEPCSIVVKRATVTALDMLAAGTSKGCISSYEVVETENGHYLVCVEGRCEDTGFYWAIYRNGALTCEGVDGVIVGSGDEITFSYEAYPTALALAGCV